MTTYKIELTQEDDVILRNIITYAMNNGYMENKIKDKTKKQALVNVIEKFIEAKKKVNWSKIEELKIVEKYDI